MAIYSGDRGTVILIDMGENISTATSVLLKVRKPDGTNENWVPVIYADQFLKYVVNETDLDQNGTYLLQPDVAIENWIGLGTTCKITVRKEYT